MSPIYEYCFVLIPLWTIIVLLYWMHTIFISQSIANLQHLQCSSLQSAVHD